VAAADNQVIFSNLVFKHFKTIFCYFLLDLAGTRLEDYEYEKNEIYCFKGLKLRRKANELYLKRELHLTRELYFMR
jgi:hypothetical protein